MRFDSIQNEFMRHIRNPEFAPAPAGIEPRRLKIYRELFFNNIKGFLSSAFPVLESIYGETKWEELARQFFVLHDCRSPYFVDISKEFVEFLTNEYVLTDSDHAFILELAHYEWVELEMSVRNETETNTNSRLDSDGLLRLSKLAQLLSYQYPVHQISIDYLPDCPSDEPNYFVVHRFHDDEVKFTQINAVTAHLINLLIHNETATLAQLTEAMIEALSHLPKEQVSQATSEIVQQMLDLEIFVQQGVDDC